MGTREFLSDVHARADVDHSIVRRVGLLVVSGWIGGFAWHLAQARLNQVEKLFYSVVLFIIGIILVAGIEYATAVGDVVADREENTE